MPSTTAAIIMTVVSAGISAYGMYAQGQSQKAIANFNAQEQQRQAEQQMRMMQGQAEMQRQQADANFKMRQAEADARLNNARLMRQRVAQQDDVNQVNLRKRREEFAQMQGEQRARIAASGVAESTGTPLDLLAETAAKIQQDQEEQHYIAEVNRRTLLNEAQMEKLGGKLALVGATLDRDSMVAEAGLRDAASYGAFLSGMRESELTRLTGAAAAQAGMYNAAGTLLSGFTGATDIYMRANPPKPKGGGSKPVAQGTAGIA